MSGRIEVPREERPDGRVAQKGDIGPLARSVDAWTNPAGHEIYSAAPCDADPKAQYEVPDCAYKGFDSFTWKEGCVSPVELPCCHGDDDPHQTDDVEEIQPYKR